MATGMNVVDGIYAGSGSRDPSAIVQADSTTQGVLWPRMTTAQRNALANPATGLEIFNTTSGQKEVNTGTPASPIWIGTTGGGIVTPGTVHARLTLASGDPTPMSDQLAKTALYLLPYQGKHIALYDGSTWQNFALGSSGISIAIPTSALDTNYDVFVYDSGGLTLELIGWLSATARNVQLALQDGVFVKSGQTGRLYLGTIRTTSVSGQSEDSLARRFIWNYYNRLRRAMRVVESADSWTYSTAAFRVMNNNNANRLQFVIGVNEEFVEAIVSSISSHTTFKAIVNGIGLDITTTNARTSGGLGFTDTSGTGAMAHAYYRGAPGIGYHSLYALEYGTTGESWYGDAGNPSLYQSGIEGSLFG